VGISRRNLRRERTAAGLTQTALGKRSGTDRSYVSGLEAGQRNPTAVTLRRLAKVLAVRLPSRMVAPRAGGFRRGARPSPP
jgi:transcriptional regulator with XRE-family HTH domain